MHKTSIDYIKDMSTSKIAKGETNDCVVRAIAASFEMSYDEAHVVAKTTFGRKDRDGVFGTINTFYKLERDFQRINRKEIKVLPTTEIRYPVPPDILVKKIHRNYQHNLLLYHN